MQITETDAIKRAVCAPIGPEGDSAEPEAELLEYVTGSREVPVPTFFIGGFGAGAAAAEAALDGASNSRLQYLGASGVVRLQGLNVAYLDGLQAPRAAPPAAPAGQHGCRFHTQVC